ncbi:hypothetical protein [Amycolatopsis jejuensis]|uniref:hypothetical protein n=1 Tax=Amycolatopsis jejuensis TaxID=330084 RepID=UPI000526EBA7|nr:hypothetical protein [Amycolatopsis jejuensis]
MTSNTKLTIPGTGLPVCSTLRQDTGVFMAAHFGGTRRVERTWTRDGIALASAAVVAYPQVDADLPTIKQFRVPLSIRERSS